MATTTTNYGFDIPQSTDLVKDGATAIATLGQDIDTAMNTALGTKKAGMVLLNTTSFSGVASQSFNDVFSATYENYAVKFSNFSFTSTGQILNMRLRVAGSDSSAASYSNQYLRGYATTPATNGTSGDTKFNRLAYSSTTTASPLNIEFVSPFATARTYMSSQSFQPDIPAQVALELVAGYFNATTSFTGFTIYPDSGNITGTVSIYGYNK